MNDNPYNIPATWEEVLKKFLNNGSDDLAENYRLLNNDGTISIEWIQWASQRKTYDREKGNMYTSDQVARNNQLGTDFTKKFFEMEGWVRKLSRFEVRSQQSGGANANRQQSTMDAERAKLIEMADIRKEMYLVVLYQGWDRAYDVRNMLARAYNATQNTDILKYYTLLNDAMESPTHAEGNSPNDVLQEYTIRMVAAVDAAIEILRESVAKAAGLRTLRTLMNECALNVSAANINAVLANTGNVASFLSRQDASADAVNQWRNYYNRITAIFCGVPVGPEMTELWLQPMSGGEILVEEYLAKYRIHDPIMGMPIPITPAQITIKPPQ